VTDADHVRLRRIAGKLAEGRALRFQLKAFGVESHEFKLGAPLPESWVAEFEERHEILLPPEYRLFVTEVGDGGAGPGAHLSRLSQSCGTGCRAGHLTRPSPYLPGPRYLNDWEQRYEDPPGPGRMFLPGTLDIAGHGCTLVTRLIVTGPARGRLFNLDCDGTFGPYVVEDTDFLSWYERWLDEALAGYDIGWFGERLPLEEPELTAALAGDPSPERRARAGESLLQLPGSGDRFLPLLAAAMATDPDATVRAAMWDLLRWNRYGLQRGLDNAEEAADDIAWYARSRTPLDLRALDQLGRLTAADVLAELAAPELERRRRAAFLLAWSWRFRATAGQDLEGAAARLLGETDPLLRSHGIAVARRHRLARLYPLMRELRETETDPWTRYDLRQCLSEENLPQDDHWDPAKQAWMQDLPF
jgi:hypothetical protein